MKDLELDIFNKNLDEFLSFINKQQSNIHGLKLSSYYLDALYLKNDSKTQLIKEISKSDSLKDLWVSTIVRVIIINQKTIRRISQEMNQISYDDYRSGKLLKCIRTHYLYDEIFFGNDYMPLLVRGETKDRKVSKFIQILDQLMAISNTIQFDDSMSSVIKQLQSKSNISSFYSNYIVVRFNALTNHLKEDDIHFGPGSLLTMDYILSKKPKSHKAEMYVLKQLQIKIKEKFEIDLSLSDVENQMCEFQKTL